MPPYLALRSGEFHCPVLSIRIPQGEEEHVFEHPKKNLQRLNLYAMLFFDDAAVGSTLRKFDLSFV